MSRLRGRLARLLRKTSHWLWRTERRLMQRRLQPLTESGQRVGPEADATDFGRSITLEHPSRDEAEFDHRPVAALHTTAPERPTTRSFVSGIWITTHAAEMDRGRGLAVHNLGASDAV